MIQTSIRKRSNVVPWTSLKSSWDGSRDGNREEFAWELKAPRLTACSDFESSSKFGQNSSDLISSSSQHDVNAHSSEQVAFILISDIDWTSASLREPRNLILFNAQSLADLQQRLNAMLFENEDLVRLTGADIDIEGPLDIGRQLAVIGDLEDGWADGMQPAEDWGQGHGISLSVTNMVVQPSNWSDGHGIAPTVAGLEWLTSRFVAYYSDDLSRPYLYPTPEGGVQAEWSIGQNEASLEIDLIRHSAEWHCLNLSSGRSTEEDFDFDDDRDWERLASMIRQLGLKDE